MKAGDRVKIYGGYDYDSPLHRLGSITGTVVKFVKDFRPPEPEEDRPQAAIIELDNTMEDKGNEIRYIAVCLTYEGVDWDGEYEPGQQTIGIYSVLRIPSTGLDELSAEEVTGFECRAIFEIL